MLSFVHKVHIYDVSSEAMFKYNTLYYDVPKYCPYLIFYQMFLVCAMSTFPRHSVSFEALPSVEDSSPGLQDFLRTVFGNISCPTRDFTVAICKKYKHTHTHTHINRHLEHKWIHISPHEKKMYPDQHCVDKTSNMFQCNTALSSRTRWWSLRCFRYSAEGHL